MRSRAIRFFLFPFLCAVLFAGYATAASAQGSTTAGEDEYRSKIAPIFEHRCIACHSCYNAPCQFNLQYYSGASRGATKQNVYNAERLRSVPPTRIDIDARNTAGWRKKGFYDVLGAGDAQSSLLVRLTKLRQTHGAVQPDKQAAASQICPADTGDAHLKDDSSAASLGMPYGLPALSDADVAALEAWVAHGAPGPKSAGTPERKQIDVALLPGIKTWEAFFNRRDARHRLVSRYIYEHLFLAHLYFSDHDFSGHAGAAKDNAGKAPQFFRLVRSRTACDRGVDEIATRRPSDPPGAGAMFYCFRPVLGAIVEKTHIPYALSAQKLKRIDTLFFGTPWKIGKTADYAHEHVNNPFVTFAAIPVKARYQFLLDDAQYHVATFIKGPVCNGSAAVNSIQEQFLVFFLKPDADSMVMLPTFAKAAESKLILPGAWGSDVDVLQDLPFLTRIIDYREAYRRLRAESARTLRPNGYGLDDIWDGGGDNPNALLTVFRHDDNAAVFKGAVGDLSKTAFVLDYPLFERLVYNLVVNFDVFGNVGHQVLTRVYMDLIRMEAEELFLSLLPPEDRQALRNSWYQGSILTDLKLRIVFPITNLDAPTAVRFHDKDHKLELVEQILFGRLPGKVRGPSDPINWRLLHQPDNVASGTAATETERELRAMAALPAVDAMPFSRYFPELSLILLKRKDGGSDVYSIVHNREHENVSWIMGEDLRLAPQQDTLTIRKGILGAYPNMLFEVDERDVSTFTSLATLIRSANGFKTLVDRFGVKRTSPRFWEVFDRIGAVARAYEPLNWGTLDLTRYELAK